jgi:hypothetical protein
MRCLIALSMVLVAASSSFAQTIYEPVHFQYGSGDRTFYYGGTDPSTFRRGAFYGVRTIENEPLRVYTDRLPYTNAATYGFTIDDARNEANNDVPRYFRMADIYAHSYTDGAAVIVPSRPMTPVPQGTIEIRPYVRPVVRPMSPVIVIPKELLNKPLTPAPSSPRA